MEGYEMTETNNGAFPFHAEYYTEESGVPENRTRTQFGLSKREYFAAMAMQGLCANEQWYKNSNGNPEWYSNKAVEIADALITELNKEQ